MRSEEIGKRGVACAEAWGGGVGVGVGDGVGVGVGVGDGVGVGVGVGDANLTPLLQTNFFPDLMQV